MLEQLSQDGSYIRVRSCTERHGVWVEVYKPHDQDRERVRKKIWKQHIPNIPFPPPSEGPDLYLFIPGDIKDAVAREIVGTVCDVEIGDDDMMGMVESA